MPAVDDTDYLQGLIDNNETVVIEKDKEYWINAERGLRLHTDSSLQIDGRLRAIPTSSPKYSIIKIEDGENISICGSGTVQGERWSHKGQGGEFGHGIEILRSHFISIQDITLRDCWGDGCCIDHGEGQEAKSKAGASDIFFDNVKFIANRRQGLSVIEINGLTVTRCLFQDIGGTAPGDGIDLETDASYKEIKNVKIFGNTFKNTKGSNIAVGFEVGTYKNIVIHGNSHDFKSQPIAITGHIGGGDEPQWARLAKALFSWWDGYSYWGYPTRWSGP